jgi:hypothetical protein
VVFRFAVALATNSTFPFITTPELSNSTLQLYHFGVLYPDFGVISGSIIVHE